MKLRKRIAYPLALVTITISFSAIAGELKRKVYEAQKDMPKPSSKYINSQPNTPMNSGARAAEQGHALQPGVQAAEQGHALQPGVRAAEQGHALQPGVQAAEQGHALQPGVQAAEQGSETSEGVDQEDSE